MGCGDQWRRPRWRRYGFLGVGDDSGQSCGQRGRGAGPASSSGAFGVGGHTPNAPELRTEPPPHGRGRHPGRFRTYRKAYRKGFTPDGANLWLFRGNNHILASSRVALPLVGGAAPEMTVRSRTLGGPRRERPPQPTGSSTKHPPTRHRSALGALTPPRQIERKEDTRRTRIRIPERRRAAGPRPERRIRAARTNSPTGS